MAEAAVALRNITPFDEIVLEIDELYAEVGNWADGTDIETDEQDAFLDDLDKRLLKAGQKADELREAEKAPLDDQVKAIQAKYHPLIGNTKAGKGRVPKAREALQPIRARYRAKKEAAKLAASAKAAAEAAALKAKADAEMQASTGNLAAREAAEETLALAKEAEKFAGRQHKQATTGLGLRTIPQATVTDFTAASRHYWSARQDAFRDLVQSLADADVRGGKREIPGVTVTEIKKAI